MVRQYVRLRLLGRLSELSGVVQANRRRRGIKQGCGSDGGTRDRRWGLRAGVADSVVREGSWLGFA